ncbi:MAG: hypothetical protein IPJ65_11230 [Archangiaceae bacterium]|nr:hypothetical protein [Archangiaceae bacterium]
MRALIALLLLAAPAFAHTRDRFAQYSDFTQVEVESDRIFLLRKNGNILLDDGASLSVYDPGTGTRQIAVDKGVVYALKDNGNVWRRFDGGAWEKLDEGTGTKQIFAKVGGVYALKTDGNIWFHDDTGWKKIDEGTGTKQIVVDRQGNVYALKENGNVWEYDGAWRKIDDGEALGRSPSLAGSSTRSSRMGTSGRGAPRGGARSTTAPAPGGSTRRGPTCSS